MSSTIDPKKYLSKELLFICRMLSFEEGYKGNEFVADLKALSPEVLLTTLKQHHIFPVFYTRWVPLQNDQVLQAPEWVEFTDNLKNLVYSNRLQMLHKLKVLVEVTSALEKENISVISLKGPALSKVLYGDFAMKASLDLDILVDGSQVDEAMAVLKRMGFVSAKYNLELTSSQKKYLINHFHHLVFYHPGEEVHLELHWQLNTNKYFLEFVFEELWQEALEIKVGEQGIRTLNGKYLIPYLMVHGGHHAWYRLDWLYDFSVALNKVHPTIEEIKLTCKSMGLPVLFDLSMKLSRIVFQTNYRSTQSDPKIEFCLSAMNKVGISEFTSPLLRFGHKIFLMHLKNGFHYKAQVFLSTRTNMLDWATIKLPDKLFFLYYFLRPFVITVNKFRLKNKKVIK